MNSSVTLLTVANSQNKYVVIVTLVSSNGHKHLIGKFLKFNTVLEIAAHDASLQHVHHELHRVLAVVTWAHGLAIAGPGNNALKLDDP